MPLQRTPAPERPRHVNAVLQVARANFATQPSRTAFRPTRPISSKVSRMSRQLTPEGSDRRKAVDECRHPSLGSGALLWLDQEAGVARRFPLRESARVLD